VTLSEHLREGTADVHRDAERSTFVSRFVTGTLDRNTYSRHLLALHGVYAALEDALERRRGDGRLGAFHLPALWRCTAIESDLEFLRGDGWRREQPVPASGVYASHVRAIDDTQPIRLVSHAYVRYLGDLSGGQMLKRMAAKVLGLDGDGLRFYEFPAITDTASFRTDFRRRLDELAVADGERDALLDEARTAFRLNGMIFDQLVAA
jgi:heme oxygenase